MDARPQPVAPEKPNDAREAEDAKEAPDQAGRNPVAGFRTGLQEAHHLAAGDGDGRPANACRASDGGAHKPAEAAGLSGVPSHHGQLLIRRLLTEDPGEGGSVSGSGGPEGDIHGWAGIRV